MINRSVPQSNSTIRQALKESAGTVWYWLLGFAVFVGTLLFAIWLPNISFLGHTAVSSNYTASQKASLFFASLGALDTNFTPLSRTLTIIVALLFAVNIALVVFYFRKRAKVQQAAGLGFAGALSGLLGVGCAACGSVILSSVFGIGATAGFIGVLPLKGQEFGIASIIILSASVYLVYRKINDPLVCEPSQKYE